MSESVRDILARLRTVDEPQLSAFRPDAEGQNTILRNLPCGLIVRDAEEGLVVEVNDYALDLFGVQRFSVIGQTLSRAGLSVDVREDSGLTAPGKPVTAHIRDSSGATIPVLLFQRRIRISGKKADIMLFVDSTLLGGSRSAEVSFNMFKRALAESETAFIFARVTGEALERDLTVSETGGPLPEEIAAKAVPGASVSDLFPPVGAARLVENAIILSKNGGEKVLELRDTRKMKLYAEPGGYVLITFPAECEEKKALRAKKSQLSSSIKRAVLYIADPDSDRSGIDMIQMIGFQIIEVESPSSAHILLEESPGRFHFVISEDFTDDPDLISVAVELERSGVGMILIADSDFSHGDQLRLVRIPPPLSINLLASAVSEVSG
jgi:PAS domain-containing protein